MSGGRWRLISGVARLRHRLRNRLIDLHISELSSRGVSFKSGHQLGVGDGHRMRRRRDGRQRLHNGRARGCGDDGGFGLCWGSRLRNDGGTDLGVANVWSESHVRNDAGPRLVGERIQVYAS